MATIPQLDIESIIGEGGLYAVIAFNNDTTSFDAVIEVLINYANKTPQEAQSLASFIHNNGSAEVYRGDFNSCETLVDAFSNIGVKAIIETQ